MSYSNVTIEPYAKGCYQCFFFRQSFISVAGCNLMPSQRIGKGFGAVYDARVIGMYNVKATTLLHSFGKP